MDWTGNSNSVYMTLGASNHTDKGRENNDYYATEPKATELLCDLVEFTPMVWEPACGEGHISKVLEKRGYVVKSSDLIDRGYGFTGIDFLAQKGKWHGDIITNPPYKYATEFVRKALELIDNGYKVAMFLKLQFLEGKERKKLFTEYPLKTLYVSSSRLQCAKNADFEGMKKGGGSAVAFGWFVWEKGYKGESTIKWFN
ncbi:MAG: NAD(P)-dependent oxidoreductase [Roseburia sp.]|nr:NAD(P)-dependent oxidoreductase [Roseburia sp.]